MFKNLKVSLKLTLFTAFMSAGIVLVGGYGLYGISTASARLQKSLDTEEQILKAVDAVRKAQIHFKIQDQEWKNALLRGSSRVDFEKHMATFNLEQRVVQALLQVAKRAIAELGVEAAAVDSIAKRHEEFGERYLAAAKQYDGKKEGSAFLVDRLVLDGDRVLNEELDHLDATIMRTVGKIQEDTRSDVQSGYLQSRNIFLVVIGVTLLAAILFAVLIVRSVSVPLARAVRIAEAVAAGNLRSRIDVNRGDEFGLLLAALRNMNDSLMRVVTEVRDSGESIHSAAKQVTHGNADLSRRTEQQASSLEETASSMEQMTATVKQNSENAEKANALANTASATAAKGGQAFGAVITTMDAIQESARKIVDIIGVIDSIAFQTNILALNAAVEAARAGEQGRGFAVVATEVRSLSHRSADAAKQVKALIGDSVGKVDSGMRLVEQVGGTMEEMLAAVNRVTQIMTEITSASNEQASGIDQINLAITHMEQGTQQNAALVEQATAAALSMEEQAERLHQVVGFFKLEKESGITAGAAAKGDGEREREGERDSGARALPARARARRLNRQDPGRAAASPVGSRPNESIPAQSSGGKPGAAPATDAVAGSKTEDHWEEF